MPYGFIFQPWKFFSTRLALRYNEWVETSSLFPVIIKPSNSLNTVSKAHVMLLCREATVPP